MTPEPDPEPEPDPPTPTGIPVTYSQNASGSFTVWLQTNTTWDGSNVVGSTTLNSTDPATVYVPEGNYYVYISPKPTSFTLYNTTTGTNVEIGTTSVTNGTLQGRRSTSAVAVSAATSLLFSHS